MPAHRKYFNLPESKTCPECGRDFPRPAGYSHHRWHKAVVCSLFCASARGRRRKAESVVATAPIDIKPCLACGEMFARKPYEYGKRWQVRQFCSRDCSGMHGGLKPTPLRERLFARLACGQGPNGDCWEWGGAKVNHGYGKIGIAGLGQGVTDLTHRVAYLLKHGEIPDGMEVCHRCDNPPCCNPDHLFIGTHGDNMRDMSTKGRANNQPNRPGLVRDAI